MNRIRNIRRFLILFLALLLLLTITGCSIKDRFIDKEKPECNSDSECSLNDPCKEGICSSGVCTTIMKYGCCGNNVCEAGSNENRCNCENDCGKCEGNLEYTDEYGRKRSADYFPYSCISGKCTISYGKVQAKPVEVYYDVFGNSFRYGIVVSYNEPFDINTGVFKLEIITKEKKTDAVRFPINLEEIRIMSGPVVIARLTGITQNITEDNNQYLIQLQPSYSMMYPEEKHEINIQMDYKVIKQGKKKLVDGSGKTLYDEHGQVAYEYYDTGTIVEQIAQNLEKIITFINPYSEGIS